MFFNNKNKKELNNIIICARKEGYDINGLIINPKKLVFEERVKMNCFYCGKYNNSWKCPPRIPEIDIKKLFKEYANIAFIYIKKKCSDNFDLARVESTQELHRALLFCEKLLWNQNKATAISFIGGSCKLCKNGCNPEKCANPYLARSPVEALGINVVKSAKKYGIEICFPPNNFIIRVGMLLW